MLIGLGQIAARDSYFNDLVVATNGTIFIFDPNGVRSTATGNSGISSTNPVSMCFLNQQVFFASGVSTVGVMSTGNLSSTFACGILTASTVPSTQSVPTFCSLDATWRGRLVLAGDKNNPQNFYMARLGKPTDWNYAATDAAAAVAGNLSQSGQIGEPITAIIPFNDDLMIMSTINEVWLIEGDPADGGSIVRLADHGGIVGPYAWCTDPTGTLFYLTQAGLWSVKPIWSTYRPPELISGQQWSKFFEQLNPNTNAVFMQWDSVNKYLRIYITPIYSGLAGQHIIFDSRNGGFWPIQYPQTTGPTATTSFIGGGSLGQLLLIGGMDGWIYYESSTRADDAMSTSTTGINAFATYQPVQFGVNNFVLSRVEVDGGELPPGMFLSTSTSPWNLQLSVVGAPTAANAADIPYPTTDSTSASTSYQTWTTSFSLDGRAPVQYPRLQGSWFGLTVSNGVGKGYFSVERIELTAAPGGLNRYQR